MTENEQQKAFNTWIAELPARQKLMTHNELYQMVCDKVGKADRETMVEWVRQLRNKVGVATRPWIDYKWWQRFVSDPELTVHIGGGWLKLHDDGSHKWRYMTKKGSRDWEFILRNMSETAELQLQWFPWDKNESEMIGLLRLRTATISTTVQLSEDDCKALSESVREKMNCRGTSDPQERMITEIGEVFPKSYTVTEQIYSSPILYIDDPVAEAEMVRTGQIKGIDLSMVRKTFQPGSDDDSECASDSDLSD